MLSHDRLRASIAVFFSRHKDAPAILLGAAAAAGPPDAPLIREMLFEAKEAVLVARQYTTGATPAEVAHAALRAPRAPRDPAGPVTVTGSLLDGFATRIAVGYPPAVPLLRAAVAALFTGEQAAPAGIPATILGWFAADDLWDDEGRRALPGCAEAVQRRHGALGALRVTLAGLTTGEVWAGRLADAEARYLEAAEISASIGVPPPATTGVLLEVRAWQGRERESRALAELTAQWGHQRGAAMLGIFALIGLTVLEMAWAATPKRWAGACASMTRTRPAPATACCPRSSKPARAAAAAAPPRPRSPGWPAARRPAAPAGRWACWPGRVRCWPTITPPRPSTAMP